MTAAKFYDVTWVGSPDDDTAIITQSGPDYADVFQRGNPVRVPANHPNLGAYRVNFTFVVEPAAPEPETELSLEPGDQKPAGKRPPLRKPAEDA